MIAHAPYSVAVNQIILPLRGSIVFGANASFPPASAMASVKFLGPRPSNVGAILLRRQAGVYSVFMEGRGIYRERNGWGTQHSVRVKYDEHQELDISEDRYRARSYQPPFDQLPWKDESANDNT
jgi:hypothetical protein